MRIKSATAGLCLLAAPLSAQDPLSAIDWLENAPAATPQAAVVERDAAADEPPTSRDATSPGVTVQTLDAAGIAGVGLLPSRVTGFPETLWSGSQAVVLSNLVAAQPVQMRPAAAQALLISLLLAEAGPPLGKADEFLDQRLDGLMRRGAIGPAFEMIRLIPEIDDPVLFARWADLALLNGAPAPVCTAALTRRSVAPAMPLQVYCAAQDGQWDKAVTLLEAGHALGDIDAGAYERLLRFLDPELAEELPALPPPPVAKLDPLGFRLLQAMGEPLPTSALPLPFTVADLTGDAGWKAQLEAAERLVRAGAIGEAQLFAAYTDRMPAASGGIWDRAEAVQRFDVALTARDPQAVSATLARVWPLMQKAGLGVAFARHFAERLSTLPLNGEALRHGFAIALLSPNYETAARVLEPATPEETFALGVARGAPDAPPDEQARAIAAAWNSAEPPKRLAQLAQQGRLGEALLRALSVLQTGADGDHRALTDALAFLRSVGLEDAARRIALQLRLDAPPA